ncbi:MAG: bifunctional metallophosphatase/5'-nucleotidase [bacterium]|nr:bifunctional metallophosphatase/5'-nucleotidase [bacterium]
MKNILFLILFLLLSLFSCSTRKVDSDINIIHLHSLNGYIFPSDKDGIKVGGIGLISQKVKELKDETNDNSPIILANSNFIYGSVETYFTEGKAVIDLLNFIECSALVLGHREFHFGEDTLKQLSNIANFPFISANIVKKDDGSIPEYIIPYFWNKEKDFAIIGVSSYMVIDSNVPEDIKKIKLLDPQKSLEKYIRELREKKVGKIFVAGDFSPDSKTDSIDYEEYQKIVSVDADLFWGRANTISNYNSGLIIDNDKKNQPKKIAVTGNKGRTLGFYSFSPQKGDEDYKIYNINSDLIKPDPQIKEIIAQINLTMQQIGSSVIGKSKSEITHNFQNESALGNFITDVLRSDRGYDIFLYNSGSMRHMFPEGDITKLNMYKVLPWIGTISEITMTGEQILKILESSCSFKLEKSFLQVSGIKFKFDSSKTPGERIIEDSVWIGTMKLEKDKTYKVGTSRYVFNGGDRYNEFKDMGLKEDDIYQKPIREIVKEYIIKNGVIDSKIEGRILDVNKGK